jgi:hypothetical protein
MGNRKSIIILPDGSLIVNNRYRDFYTKFSPNGTFEKEFRINGKTIREFRAIEGYIGTTFFTGLDNMGNMICFDMNGNYKKSLKLDYMANKMVALPNKKIAVVGWALWQDKCHEFVSLVDFETNQEKIIWDHFTPDMLREMFEKGLRKPFNYFYKSKNGGAFGFNSIPYARANSGMVVPPDVEFTNNKIIIAVPVTGEILTYDLNGNLQKKEQVSWQRGSISIEEQRQIQQKAIDEYKSKSFRDKNPEFGEILTTLINDMQTDLDQIKEPIPLPYVSTIIKDSDGNLLFFEFAKEQNGNKFNVWIYDNGGKFICQSSFVCDEYDLEINPSKMVFYNGYIYSLQKAKDVKGVPLRLVRFKLSN